MERESLVTAAGESVTPAWRLIRFDSEEGRRLSASHPAFAPVTLLVAEDEHGRALAPRPVTGWRTYNLEGLHTYVAGGIRVHNDYFGFVTMMSDDCFATVANMMRNPHGPRVGKLPLRTEAYIRCTKDSTLQKQLSGSQVTR